MTSAEISKLSEEYARYKTHDINDKESLLCGYRQIVYDIQMRCCLEWLVENHLIVESEKVINLWEASQLESGMHQHDDVVEADAVANTIRYLFPDIFKTERYDSA